MPSIPEVSRALNAAFDDLTAGQPEDTYVSVSAAWTNAAGKLISMHISIGDTGDEEDEAADIDVERPRTIRPIDGDYLDPEYTR